MYVLSQALFLILRVFSIIESLQQPQEVGVTSITTPILQVGKPRHGDSKSLADMPHIRHVARGLGCELRHSARRAQLLRETPCCLSVRRPGSGAQAAWRT